MTTLKPHISKSERIVAVTGASGLIGSYLVDYLRQRGYTVKRLVRHKPSEDSLRQVYWNPGTGHIESDALEGLYALINLSGENLATKRWTQRQKERIWQSRIQSTRLLSHTITRLKVPPKVFISVSAIGFYGDRDDEQLSEESKPGVGFLAELCRAWESSTHLAEHAGIRVVHPRLGAVLSAEGGMLKKLLPLYKLGLGGPMGPGKQKVSWISIHDVARGLAHIMNTPTLEGPVNLVSKQSVSNAEFSAALLSAMSRKKGLSIPVSIARLFMGEMVDSLMLSSQSVTPQKLIDTAFDFRDTDLEQTLRKLIYG